MGTVVPSVSQEKLATTINDPAAPYAQNLLKKSGSELDELDKVWVGDVGMVVTKHKKERGFLASLLDRDSRRCVGWAVSPINDTVLTLGALNRAIAERQPAAGLIHHSDHGSNYTSHLYQERLREIGARISHSRPGRPQENSLAESFNKTISYEKLFLEEYANLAEAEAGIGDWITRIYNERRLHSGIGYLPPVEFEERSQLAA
jgi:putative transposase